MRQVQVHKLFLSQVVLTDPLRVNPSLLIATCRNGGVPAETTVIFLDGGAVIWEPTGEVRSMP